MGKAVQSRQNPVVLGVTLAKVNDRLAVWRLVNVARNERLNIPCKSERPLSGLETVLVLLLLLLLNSLAKVNDRLAVWRQEPI
jgi:hypothetical protein